MARLVDADALYNGAMKDEYFSFKEHDKNGRESFAYSCAMQRLADAPTVEAIPISWLDELLVTGEYDESKAAWRVEKAWSQYLEGVGDGGNNHT